MPVKFKRISKKKVFWTFLLSYLLIFLLPTLALVYSSNSSLSLIDQRLETDNRLMLEQFYSGADTLFITAQRVGDLLAFDTATSYFSDRNDFNHQLNSAYAYQNVKHLQTQLSNISTIYTQVKGCYIFYSFSERVLSFDGVFDSNFFFNQRLSSQFENQEQWRKFLYQIDDAGFLCNKNILSNSNENYIFYVRRIQTNNEQPPIYVVITLNNEFLNQQGSGFNQQNKFSTAIYNSDLITLYNSNSKLIFDKNKITSEDYGWFISTSNRSTFRNSWIRSHTSGCIYLLSIPESLYISPLIATKTSNILIIFIVLITGILLSYLLAKRSYHPIKLLREFIVGKPPVTMSLTYNGNDFDYLRDVLEKLSNEKGEIEKELNQQSHTMKNSMIERLLYSNFPSKLPVGERLQALNIRFDTTDFAVVILRIESPEILALRGETLTNQLSNGALWEEMLGIWYNTYTTTIEGDTVLLVNFRNGAYDEQKSRLQESMYICHKMIYEKYGVLISLYVSDVQHTFAGIHIAFRDTLFLSEYHRKSGEVVFAWEALNESRYDLYYSYKPETEQKLMNIMMAGEIDEAKKLILQVHEENIKNMPMWFEKVIIIDLLSSCVKAMNLVRANDRCFSQIECKMRQLLHDDPEKYCIQEVLNILEMVCEVTRTKAATCKSMSIDEKVRAIISEEYTNSELCVSSIAEQLNINPNYATALYKKRTGESILDSINFYRLNKAIDLLKSSSKDVKDIAIQVGYYNSAGFIRAFKKFKGITPGQYRSMHHNNPKSIEKIN